MNNRLSTTVAHMETQNHSTFDGVFHQGERDRWKEKHNRLMILCFARAQHSDMKLQKVLPFSSLHTFFASDLWHCSGHLVGDFQAIFLLVEHTEIISVDALKISALSKCWSNMRTRLISGTLFYQVRTCILRTRYQYTRITNHKKNLELPETSGCQEVPDEPHNIVVS